MHLKFGNCYRQHSKVQARHGRAYADHARLAPTIRSSTRYVSYKDIKGFTAALKPIYKAPTEEAGLAALDELETAWGVKYPAAIKSWRTHWDELATMFKYPEEIRRIIYTTNAIENFNRQLRKVTKTKSAFVSDDALLKQLYLV